MSKRSASDFEPALPTGALKNVRLNPPAPGAPVAPIVPAPVAPVPGAPFAPAPAAPFAPAPAAPAAPAPGALFAPIAPIAPIAPAPVAPVPGALFAPIAPAPAAPAPAPFAPIAPEPAAASRMDTSSTPRATGGRKTRRCKTDATFVWLNVWYKNDFEKLGWIILAKNNGDHVKVEAYKNSVKRLYYQLDCKIKSTRDRDKKQDLMIMLKNVKCLLVHIHKDF